MKNLIVFFLGIAILSIGACSKKIDTEADVAAIKSLSEKYDATINSGDLDGLVSIYTDDVVYMQPNMPALVGKDALRDYFQYFFEQFTAIEMDLTTEEVIVCGDWAFARGTYTITFTPKVGGEPIQDTGKWMGFNKCQPDGSWKYYRGIHNSDLPPSDAQ